MMTPELVQVPPRGSGAPASTCALPPGRSTRLSFPCAKNPSDRLSGDQNGPVVKSVPSVPGTGVSPGESSALSQIEARCDEPSPLNTTYGPSAGAAGSGHRLHPPAGGRIDPQ